MLTMTKRKKILLWVGLVVSIPVTGYAGVSVIFYAWLSAANPERWSPERAGLWSGGALVLTVLFLSLFVYCLVSLIRNANKEYRCRQAST